MVHFFPPTALLSLEPAFRKHDFTPRLLTRDPWLQNTRELPATATIGGDHTAPVCDAAPGLSDPLKGPARS